MSIIFKFPDYDENELFFVESVKNNVKSNSYFSRIIYSNYFMSLKNIYFAFTLKDVNYRDQYLKTIIYFDESKNDLTELYNIEKNIIDKYIAYRQNYNNEIINPCYCIKQQFKLNYIKVFKNSTLTNPMNETTEIFIKISGIWQTDNTVGITFKFI